MVLISAGKLYLHQIAQEIVFSPVDNLHEKKNKTKQNKARARILNFPFSDTPHNYHGNTKTTYS